MKIIKSLIVVIILLCSVVNSQADRQAIPSGNIAWPTVRDTYLNPMTLELYNFLGATAGVLPATPTFSGLIVSGDGDSWLELENNTSFTDSLTGKYGIRFYNGVLQQIINGTASVIGSGGSAPTLQADDPDMSDATGWYLATGSGDLFYVNSGIGMWTFSGTYSGDVIDPVIGAVTPSALTHDGTEATLTATVASITEANEDYRQWSLYDVTDAAIQTDWATFTGLSISGITIPADQHTYRVDVRVYDLAGNVGTASSADIVYEAVGGALIEWDGTGSTLQTYVESSTVTTTNSDFTSGHIYIDADGTANYVCTDGQSINLDKGTIEFTFVRRAAPDNYGILFQMGNVTSGAGTFQLRYYSSSGNDQQIQFRYNGNRLNYAISTFDASGIQLNTEYICKLDWDNTNGSEIHNLTIGAVTSAGTFVEGSSLGTKPTVGSNVMYIGTNDTGAYKSMSEIRDWKVYDEVQP